MQAQTRVGLLKATVCCMRACVCARSRPWGISRTRRTPKIFLFTGPSIPTALENKREKDKCQLFTNSIENIMKRGVKEGERTVGKCSIIEEFGKSLQSGPGEDSWIWWGMNISEDLDSREVHYSLGRTQVLKGTTGPQHPYENGFDLVTL